MCENGEGIEQDFQAAFEWYMLAADFDHSDAQVVVGNYYYHGTNGVVKENRDEAFVWYGRAARMGNTIGMYSLALMYERGEEIKQSDSLASYWLKKSALQESPEGRYKVGRYYIEGKGIEKNGELARTWLESSSLQDYAPAMFLLGQMYLEGNEIPKNRVEGIKWIEEAIKSAQNDEDKQEYQRYLRQETDEPA
jgi:TPR repeat protein